jgi:hypothetical protein
LNKDVWRCLAGFEPATCDKSERHGRVEVAARNLPESKRKRHNGAADRQRDAENAGGSGGRSK